MAPEEPIVPAALVTLIVVPWKDPTPVNVPVAVKLPPVWVEMVMEELNWKTPLLVGSMQFVTVSVFPEVEEPESEPGRLGTTPVVALAELFEVVGSVSAAVTV